MPGYFRANVKQALLDAFSTRELRDGTAASFTGQLHVRTARLSESDRCACDAGSWRAKRRRAGRWLQAIRRGPARERDAGFVPIHRLEIARVDNDPSLPENGRIDFVMREACDQHGRRTGSLRLLRGRCSSTTACATPALPPLPTGSTCTEVSSAHAVAAVARGIEDAPNVLRYPLSRLATRSTGDPAIAILDAWALVADVLTFYQERIANEGYLARRRSVGRSSSSPRSSAIS